MQHARRQARQQQTQLYAQARMPLFVERLESRAMLTAVAAPDFTSEADCPIAWECDTSICELESAPAAPLIEADSLAWCLFLKDDFQYTDDSLSTDDWPEYALSAPDGWVPLALAAAAPDSDFADNKNEIATPPDTTAIPAGMAWAFSLYGVADTVSHSLSTRPLRIAFPSDAFVATEPTAFEPDATCLMPLMAVDSTTHELAADARPLPLMLSQDAPEGTLIEPLTSKMSIGVL